MRILQPRLVQSAVARLPCHDLVTLVAPALSKLFRGPISAHIDLTIANDWYRLHHANLGYSTRSSGSPDMLDSSTLVMQVGCQAVRA